MLSSSGYFRLKSGTGVPHSKMLAGPPETVDFQQGFGRGTGSVKSGSALERTAGLCCSAAGPARSALQKCGLPSVTELQGQLLNVILVPGELGHSGDDRVKEKRHAQHRHHEERKEVRNLFQNAEKFVTRGTHMHRPSSWSDYPTALEPNQAKF